MTLVGRGWWRQWSPSGGRRLLSSCLFTLLAVALLAPATATAQTAEELVASAHVLIRARMEPTGPVYVGQKAELVVDVLTRTWFLAAPNFPVTVDVADAVVLPPQAFGVNFSERIDGQAYAGQTRRLTIFPTGVGAVDVPPIEVKLVVARDDASRSPEIILQTPALRFEARLPDGARGMGMVVATPELSVEESYSREFDGLVVGDSITRTITLKIENSVSMLIPQVGFSAPDGVAVYPARAKSSDQRDRGQMTGVRVDSATYMLEQEGSFELPAIVLHWWDLSSSRLRTESLDAVQLEVAANTGLEPAQRSVGEQDLQAGEAPAQSAPEGPPWKLVLAALALVAVLVAAHRPLRRVLRRIASRLRGTGDPEQQAFAGLRRALRTRDPGATFAALMAWLDRSPIVGSPATARGFVALAADPQLEDQLTALEEALYAPQGDSAKWQPRVLRRAVARARRRLRQGPAHSHRPRHHLSEINPRGGAKTR